MARSGNVIDVHFAKQFLNLPWQIIEEICFFSPPEIITEVFLKVKNLRPFIIQRFFSQEIRLHLGGDSPKVELVWIPNKPPSIDIFGSENIVRFFQENRDIVPRQYTVLIADRSIARVIFQLGNFLRSFHGTLRQASDLAIIIKKPCGSISSYEGPGQEIIDYILSFSNLSSFTTWFLPSNSNFAGRNHLKKFGFHGHEDQWSRLSAPSSLKELDIRVTFYSEDFRREDSNGNLFSLLWETTLDLGRISRFPYLKSLRIEGFELINLELSDFPPTLEILDLRGNKLGLLESRMPTGRWPKHLKKLYLGLNYIKDPLLDKLSDFGWPPLLEELDLGRNRISSLENLRNLPPSLKVLSLSGSSRLRLRVSNNSDGYPFYVFPEFLQHLDLGYCRHLLLISNGIGSVSHKLRFPGYLKSLDLQHCHVDTLADFLFPSSLEILRLDKNRLQSLRSLGTLSSPSADAELTGWKHLTNLRELSVKGNRLRSLLGWVPPESLQKIDFADNKLNRINRKTTPLFNEKFRRRTGNIRSLNLSNNAIKNLDSDLYIPRNLTYLDLSGNQINRFEFCDSLASHEGLMELNLTDNPIRSMSVLRHEKQYASNLKKIYLWRETEREKSEFRKVLEQLGLRIRQWGEDPDGARFMIMEAAPIGSQK